MYKVIKAKAEPVPDSFQEITRDLSSLSSSGTNVYEETDIAFFQPPGIHDELGFKRFSKSFLLVYGSPSPYHPLCCSIKKSL